MQDIPESGILKILYKGKKGNITPERPHCKRWTLGTSILLLAERDTNCMSKLLHDGGKGDTLHVHTVGGAVERDTPCTSILLAVERE